MNQLFSDAVMTRGLILFLIAGSVAGLFAGAALLLRPDWLLRVSAFTNRWVSTRQMTRPLVRSFHMEGWLYRHNRISGAMLMLGSIYILYFFTAVFNKLGVLTNVFKISGIAPGVMAGLIDALVLTCITGAVFVAIVSLFLLFRPSMLRELELRANHTMSLRRVLKPLENQHAALDEYVFQNVRVAGVLILAGSLYTLVVLIYNLSNI